MSTRRLVTIAATALVMAGASLAPPASAAATATPAAPQAMKLKFFKTPSGNIRCGMFRVSGKWSMRCDIYDHDWMSPPKPASCDFDWGSSVGMGGKSHPRFECVSDAMDNGMTLAYGKSLSYGPFFCKSRPKGLKCYNKRARGWFLSRESYNFF